MLRQMIEFAQKSSERQWNEERLKKYLEEKKRNFFFVVNTGDELTYKGFRVVGIENPFIEEELSKKFVNLEKWMDENKNLLKYTEFRSYREPIGSHNSCLGSNGGLGTICLSHFQLEKGEKIKKIFKDGRDRGKEILKIFNDKKTGRVNCHTRAIDNEILQNMKIAADKLEKLYTDFFEDLFHMPEDMFDRIFNHEVVIFNDNILGVKQESKIKKSNEKELLKYPKYFNGKNRKKPFLIESRTRPIKENLLISKEDQGMIHKFMKKILPDIGTPFILPLDEKLQKKMAEDIASNEKSFFKTVENLLSKKELNSGTIADRFDFYFIDIRGGKISFFDYVSNYHYYFPTTFYDIFPLRADIKPIPFNRRNLKENFSKVFGQKDLPCLPWIDPPKNMNTSKKSAYVKLREKMFETIYLGKRVLTEPEMKNLCLVLIEDSIINEDNGKAKHFSNEVLNMFINHNLYTLSGECMGNLLISKAKEIEEQISDKKFNPVGNESGFYLLGLLLKRLCDKSETSNEKSRLLQPIINAHTILGLNRVVLGKFVEKYAYKIGENDTETKELINKVLPFFAEQNGEEPIKDFKLWLYAGFFSGNDG